MWLLSDIGLLEEASQTVCQKDSVGCQVLGMTIVIPNTIEPGSVIVTGEKGATDHEGSVTAGGFYIPPSRATNDSGILFFSVFGD